MRRYRFHWILTAIAVIVSACGGDIHSGSSNGPSVTIVDTLPGIAALSGIVMSDGSASNSVQPYSGDVDGTVVGRAVRGFVSFDLSGIPAGKIIKTANLRMYQLTIAGDPYSNHGPLMLDHVIYGAGLDAADFDGGTLDSAFATLSLDQAPGIKLVNVFQKVKADIAAGRTMSQLRMRFSIKDTDVDSTSDNATFKSETDFPPPLIIVTYLN
ncbi:MAG: hypothetical protein ABI679_05135 [Gemmatimonadota bacterium]